jgi:hypothetical protein
MVRQRARRMADRLALILAARDRPLPSDALATRQRHAGLRPAIVVAALCAVSNDASRSPSRRGVDRPARRSGILLPHSGAMAAPRSAEAGAGLGADDAARPPRPRSPLDSHLLPRRRGAGDRRWRPAARAHLGHASRRRRRGDLLADRYMRHVARVLRRGAGLSRHGATPCPLLRRAPRRSRHPPAHRHRRECLDPWAAFPLQQPHAAHHERPDLPWYELPRWYRANRERLVLANGGLVYDGYAEIVRRFLFVPHDTPIHPHGSAIRSAAPLS